MRVLLIADDEDDFIHIHALCREIPNATCVVEWVHNREQALEYLASRPPFDLCLLDNRSTGRDVWGAIVKAGNSYPLILLAEQDTPDIEEQLNLLGAENYLIKGQVNAVLLERSFHSTLKQNRIRNEIEAARQREREIGAAIQKTLLLRHPPENLQGIQFGVAFLPSQNVGGDYSDFIVLDESTVDVLVGDVMGKGIPAALIAAATKSHFQRAIRRLGLEMARFGRLPEPEEILAAVHSTLTPELLDQYCFVTLIYARFDLDHQRLTFIDCGHPRPFHYQRTEGKCTVLSGYNLPLGMSLDERYRQTTVPFASGDRFVFYTDGFTEATGPNEEPFGETRLEALVCELQEQDARAAARTLEETILNYRVTPDDDMTCLVVDIGSLYRPLQLGYRNHDLPCDPQELTGVRRFIESFCQDFCQGNMSEESVYHLELAVHEAVSNIIQHAYPADAPGRIQVEAIALENKVRIRIVDYGVPFPHPEEVPHPTFDGTRDHGFGLFLVREGVDKMERFRDDMGRNILTLTKRYDRKAAGVRH